MPYREKPSKDDLFRMLSRANQEKEESASRVKELEAKLTSINTATKDHEKLVNIAPSISNKNLRRLISEDEIQKVLHGNMNTSMVDPQGITLLVRKPWVDHRRRRVRAAQHAGGEKKWIYLGFDDWGALGVAIVLVGMVMALALILTFA